MSQPISSEEKRRLMREKRAAKMAQGGTRLNKILGTDAVPGTPESTSTSTSTTTSTAAATSPEITEVSSVPSRRTGSGMNKNKNKNRISTFLEVDEAANDDHEISLESDSPLEEFVSNEAMEQEIERALNEMLQNSANDKRHGHGTASTSASTNLTSNSGSVQTPQLPEGFPDLSSLMGGNNPMDLMNMLNAAGGGNNPMDLMNMLNAAGGGNGGIPNQGVNGDLDSTKKAVQKLSQSLMGVLRFAGIFLLIWLYRDSIELNRNYGHIWTIFCTVEIVLAGLQVHLLSTGAFPKPTIMSFDVSAFSQIKAVMTAYSVLKSFFADFCWYVLVLVICTYHEPLQTEIIDSWS
jgi:hypothetical protein